MMFQLAVVQTLFCLCCLSATVAADPLIVQTNAGKVKGVNNGLTRTFYGIPYGGPVSGQHRWTHSQPAESWDGVLDVSSYPPPACPQPCDYLIIPWICVEPTVTQVEDCLFLNVFAPLESDSSSNLSVAVLIHGGAHKFGSGGKLLYDGSYIANYSNVIVVTINFRSGVLGYLVYGTGPNAINGNFGFKDQQLALKWVHDNIAVFGGDPNRVTIWGQSAGAGGVSVHVNNDYSNTFFNQVLMQGHLFGYKFRTTEKERAHGAKCIPQLNCPENDFQCLRNASLSDLFEMQQTCLPDATQRPDIWSRWLAWTPTFDGVEVKDEPVNLTKPLLIGTTLDDALMFVDITLSLYNLTPDFIKKYYKFSLVILFGSENLDTVLELYPEEPPLVEKVYQAATDSWFLCPALKAARDSASNNNNTVYNYIFNPPWPTLYPGCVDNCEGRGCHVSEIPYVHHSYVRFYSADQQRLGNVMPLHWGGFFAAADPNMFLDQSCSVANCNQQIWEPYTAADKYSFIIRERSSKIKSSHRERYCSVLEQIGFGYINTAA